MLARKDVPILADQLSLDFLVKELKSGINKRDLRIEKLEARLAPLPAALDCHMKRNGAANNAIAGLQTNLAEQTSYIGKLKKEIQDYQNWVKNLKMDIVKHREWILNLKQENAKLTEWCQNLKHENHLKSLSQQRLEDLKVENQAKIRKFEEILFAIESSRSWKCTQGFRRLAQKIRKVLARYRLSA